MTTLPQDIAHKIANVITAIHEKWVSVKDSSNVFNNGYAHFYSPPKEHADVMIIGLNPGSESLGFNEATAHELPTSHNYIEENHLLAEKMRKLFERNEQLELLKTSVKLNLLFFRSQNIGEWHSVDPVMRAELETFFEEQAKELINTLKPKKIVCEGLETMERVKTMFGSNHKSLDTKSPDRRTVYRSTTITLADESKVQLIGIMHPAARLSFADFDTMADALKKDLQPLGF